MKEVEGFMDVEELIDVACSACGIPRFRLGMGDEEIAKVCKWIGEQAPSNELVDGKKVIGAEGFDAMIFLTMTEFPEFYERHQLAKVWRN